MAPNLLSMELNRTGYSYWESTGHGTIAKRQLITHLLYRDELMLYGRNPDQLDGLVLTVCTSSDDIQMKFGLEIVNSKLSAHNTRETVGKMDTITIKALEPGQAYKYLGVHNSNSISTALWGRDSVKSNSVKSTSIG